MQTVDERESFRDAELLRNHLIKSDALLRETQAGIQDLENKIEEVGRGGQVLERKIARIEDLIRIRQLCSKVASKLTGIEERLVPVKTQLLAVGEERQALQKQREALRRRESALLPPLTLELFRAAPLRRCPVDILLEIFTVAKPGIQPLGEGILPLLSQVCGTWRAVAHDHPALWSSFSFSLFDLDFASVRWLELHLENSRTASLTIEVDATQRPRDSLRVSQAVTLIAAHSERLHNFRLTGTKWDSISVSGSRFLRVLDNGDPAKIQISYIRSLYLHRHAAYTLDGLDKFSNMTPLTCKFSNGWWSGTWHSQHVVLRKLSSWKLDFGSTSTPSNFFNHYTTPALESLELKSLAQPAELAAFIQRSGCNLKSLFMRKSSVRVVEVIPILEVSPKLERLAVVDGFSTAVTDKLLEAMDMGPGHAALLPRLQHLRIDGRYAFRFGILAGMLESRFALGGSVPLNSVKLSLDDRVVNDADVQRLTALKGLSVSLNCLNADKKLVRVI
ncbi:hypothetical protein B0H13DRAFT_2334076 [Mycena leptocephala]|nr:hypothetical protein B0H13DRAFT_2334076 [Mycena leptocephala]